MTVEKIFKREDGTKIKLIIRVSIDYMSFYRNIEVYKCPSGKRTYTNVHNSDDYTWRALNMEERAKSTLSKQLEYVTPEEINELCRDLTEQLYAKISL